MTPITGGPLVDPSGQALSDVTVSFELVNCSQHPVSVVDAISSDVVSGSVISTTDATGVLNASLWPNSRGVTKSQYRVTIAVPFVTPFLILVPDQATPLQLFEAMQSGGLQPC